MINFAFLDILVPTFNRVEYLGRNLRMLDKQISSLKDKGIVRVIVSNNASDDNTAQVLEFLKCELSCELVTYNQSKNIGLEPNALFLLENSSAEFIMYLGDDDFIPDDYLNFIFETLENEPDVGCIIPGFSGLYPDGKIKPARNASFEIKKYNKGFVSLIKISDYGHQLSGLVTKREGLYEAYTKDCENRNIYPFIFFVSYCIERQNAYYAPRYQVLVSQGNSKDWRYDDSGLLVDVLKNFKIIYPNSQLKRLLLSFAFASKQSWRLRVGKNPANAITAFLHLMRSKDVDMVFKFSLLGLYPYCYAKKIVALLANKIFIRAVN